MSIKPKIQAASIKIACGSCGKNLKDPETGRTLFICKYLPAVKFALLCECGQLNKVNIPKRAEIEPPTIERLGKSNDRDDQADASGDGNAPSLL